MKAAEIKTFMRYESPIYIIKFQEVVINFLQKSRKFFLSTFCKKFKANKPSYRKAYLF